MPEQLFSSRQQALLQDYSHYLWDSLEWEIEAKLNSFQGKQLPGVDKLKESIKQGFDEAIQDLKASTLVQDKECLKRFSRGICIKESALAKVDYYLRAVCSDKNDHANTSTAELSDAQQRILARKLDSINPAIADRELSTSLYGLPIGHGLDGSSDAKTQEVVDLRHLEPSKLSEEQKSSVVRLLGLDTLSIVHLPGGGPLFISRSPAGKSVTLQWSSVDLEDLEVALLVHEALRVSDPQRSTIMYLNMFDPPEDVAFWERVFGRLRNIEGVESINTIPLDALSSGCRVAQGQSLTGCDLESSRTSLVTCIEQCADSLASLAAAMRAMNIGADLISSLSQRFKQLPRLQNADVSSGLNTACAQILGKVVPQMQAIRSLSLRSHSSSSLRSLTSTSVAKAPKPQPTATESSIRLAHVGDEGVTAICEKLLNPSLTSVDMSRSHVGKQGLEMLISAVSEAPNVVTIDLSMNNFGPFGANCIAEALICGWKVSTINLSRCDLGLEGIRALSEAMTMAPNLANIDLSCTGMCEEGGFAFADAMTKSMGIQKLILSANLLGKSCKAISVNLKHLDQLASLDLGENGLDDDAGCALAEAVPGLASLEELALWETPEPSDQGYDADHAWPVPPRLSAEVLGRLLAACRRRGFELATGPLAL